MDKEVSIAQLNLLNHRVVAYASRMWQLPFAYLTVLGVLFRFSISETNDMYAASAISFAVLGIAIAVTIYSYDKRINLLIEIACDLEKQLDLKPSMVPQNKYLYLVPVVLGVQICISFVVLHWVR